MALNREQILNLNVNESLTESYLVELMQTKHSLAVLDKRLEAALTANDELHAEVNSLREEIDASQNAAEDVVQGEVTEEDYPVVAPEDN